MSEQIAVVEAPSQRVKQKRTFDVSGAIDHANMTNEGILAHWIPVWTRNAFANFELIDQTVGHLGHLEGAHEGQTAIVVSTGPSLDRNIEELKRIDRSKFVLVATSSALNPLIANGFSPEYAVINDGAPWVARLHFAGLEEHLKETALLISTSSHPSTTLGWPDTPKPPDWWPIETDWWSSRLYYNDYAPEVPLLSSSGPIMTAYNNLIGVPVSGCTTNMAIRALPIMGFSRIITIGMDLGFDAETKTGHCTKYDRLRFDWMPRPPHQDVYKQRAVWMFHSCQWGHCHTIEEWDQVSEPAVDFSCRQCDTPPRHVPTSTEYLFYFRIFAGLAQALGVGEGAKTPIEVINATGAGIAVNCKQATLEECFAETEPVEFIPRVESAEHTLADLAEVQA